MDWQKHMRRIFVRLGEDATFTPAAGSPVPGVKGIYLSPHQVLDLGGGVQVSSSYPSFAAMGEDLPAVAVGDTIAVEAGTFTVRDVQPEKPSGVTVLELEA